MPRTWRAASQRVKPSSTWGRLLAQRRHDRRALPPAPQRHGHRLHRLRHPQAVAAEVVAQLVEPHRRDLTDGAHVHRPGSCPGDDRRKGAGGPEWLQDLPAPSSFLGQ